MGETSSYIVNVWGGMNDALYPGLLPEKTAAYLCDAEVDDGKMSAMKQPVTTLKRDPVLLEHYGAINRSVVKWYERHYWSNNEATGAPYYGGAEEELGVPYPQVMPVLTENGAGVMGGTYKYCICYVNSNGWEGAPGSLTNYETKITIDDDKCVRVQAGEDFPEGVSYAKIYRTINQGADFYYIGDLKSRNDTFYDNTDDETLLTLDPMDSTDNYPPPDGGKFLCEANGVFWLAVGEKLYFSAQGNPHAWPPLNFISFDNDITGLCKEFTGILAFTRNSVYRVTGTTAEDVVKALIPGNQGCKDWHSIGLLSNAPVWLSNDGIVTWNGESLSIISYQVIDTRSLRLVCATCKDSVYYLFLDDGCLLYDLKNGGVWRKSSHTCKYAWYEPKTDKMYIQKKDEVIYEWGVGNRGKYAYKSGLIGGTELQVHRWREVYVHAPAGSYTFVFYVGGKKKVEHVFGPGRTRIKLPFGLSGKNAQVEINGAGSISEVAVYYE